MVGCSLWTGSSACRAQMYRNFLRPKWCEGQKKRREREIEKREKDEKKEEEEERRDEYELKKAWTEGGWKR